MRLGGDRVLEGVKVVGQFDCRHDPDGRDWEGMGFWKESAGDGPGRN